MELRAYEICCVKPQSPVSSAISGSSSALWEVPCAMSSTWFFLDAVGGALCNVENHGGQNMLPRKPSSTTTPQQGLKGSHSWNLRRVWLILGLIKASSSFSQPSTFYFLPAHNLLLASRCWLLPAACNECSVQQSTVVAGKLLMMTLLSGVLLFQGQVVVGGSP